MKDEQIIKQLILGEHLSDKELKRAKIIIDYLTLSLNDRLKYTKDFTHKNQ